MSTLRANIIDSHSTSTEFKETITANGDSQWLDTYGWQNSGGNISIIQGSGRTYFEGHYIRPL